MSLEAGTDAFLVVADGAGESSKEEAPIRSVASAEACTCEAAISLIMRADVSGMGVYPSIS